MEGTEPENAGGDSKGRRLDIRTMSEIQVLPVEWLWRGYIPNGMITIIEGDPGTGKSHLACELAARFTTNRFMPHSLDRGLAAARRGVLFINGEEDPARVLKPHILAAGADENRVKYLSAAVDGSIKTAVSLPRDIELLSQKIDEHDIGMIIIDPLASFVGSEINMNGDADVRRLLSELSRLAEDKNLAVIIIRHLNKKAGISSMYRGGGSIGVTAAARAVFAIGKDRDVEGGSVIAPVKCNLGPMPHSIRFRIVGEGMNSHVEWGELCDVTADELQQPVESKSAKKIDEVKALILTSIEEEDQLVTQLQERCIAAGASLKTYHRAVKELGLEPRKAGFNGPWMLGFGDAAA